MEGVMLVFHNEACWVAHLATAEAFEDVSCSIDIKRRRFLFMEGAESDEVCAASPKRDEVTHHLIDAGGLHNLCYGIFWYHFAKIRY